MTSVQQPMYPKLDEADSSDPPAYSTLSQSYPIQPQSGNNPSEKPGNPADQQVGYWNTKPSGYVGVPQSDPGFAGQPQEQPVAVIIQQQGQPLTTDREKESFVKQIVLSCIATWLCLCPLLGLIAFILAMVAKSTARAIDENSVKKAHNLGVHSFRTAIAGIIIGVLLWLTVILLNVT